MSQTLISMFTSKCSKKKLKLMVKWWKLTLSTYLVLPSQIISLNGDKTSSSPSELHFWRVRTSILQMIQNYKQQWGGLHAIAKHTTINYQMCWGSLWMPVEINKLFTC
jgi:hypothetical protein